LTLSNEKRERRLVMSVPLTLVPRAELIRFAMGGAKTDSQFASASSPYARSRLSSVVQVPIDKVSFRPSPSHTT